jgi:hypothetical protein
MGGTAILSAVNGLTPHMAGAIDIMVVQQPDGTLKCSPFYGEHTRPSICTLILHALSTQQVCLACIQPPRHPHLLSTPLNISAHSCMHGVCGLRTSTPLHVWLSGVMISHCCLLLAAACAAGCAAAVRFGKYTPMRSKDKKVQIFVNGKPTTVSVIVMVLRCSCCCQTAAGLRPVHWATSEQGACMQRSKPYMCSASPVTVTQIWPYDMAHHVEMNVWYLPNHQSCCSTTT